MDLENHYLQIQTFLNEHRLLWSPEVINTYPEFDKTYPSKFIESLRQLDPEQLWIIDSGRSTELIPDDELKTIFQKIKELSTIASAPIEDFKPQRKTWKNIKVKKRHELEKVVGFLKQTKNQFDTCIDIGGGLGHSSRILADNFEVKSHCFDRDISLCQNGKAKNPQVEFHHCEVGDNDKEKFEEVIDQNSLILGLHTCGPLANLVINRFVKSPAKSFLNFGCCYLKLDKDSETRTSKIAKANPIDYSHFALTLASRANNQRSQEEFTFTRKVKDYRYCLHLLLFHKLDKPHFLGVGNASSESYKEDFAFYALERMASIGIEHNFSAEQLNEFYQEGWVRRKVKDMFLCNVIRWRFGRLIELSLLLDRALYLEEHGQKPKLYQFFDEQISPRNIGIFVTK